MLFVAAILLAGVGMLNGQLPCYVNDTERYQLFGPKTPYEYVHEDSTEENHPGCEPKQIWLLSRHGTTLPSGEEIFRIKRDAITLQKDVSSHEDFLMCDADMNNIREWRLPNLSQDDDQILTVQGQLDLYGIAQRFQQRFPTLLGVPYGEEHFQFRSTSAPRAIDSALEFAKGLFGSSTPVNIPPPLRPDPLLETYETCPAWLENVNSSRKEMDAWIAGDYGVAMVHRVSERLGFNYDNPMTYDDVDLLYLLCRYEQAWTPNSLSTWCAAFQLDALRILEFRDDLETYYRDGYGFDLNSRLGCPLVSDLLDRFSDLEGGTGSQPLSVSYFTDSPMITMLLTTLGLFKDEIPIDSCNYPSMRNRKWRSSLFGPFASNVAAVFYECSEGGTNRFELFLEERPVSLEGCPEGELCSWEHVKQLLAKVVEECDLSSCDLQSRPLNN